MAHSQELNSTLTYENRYDLDELDVFLEGDGRYPMFFSVNGLPSQLSFGKHYFNVSILNSLNQQYYLRSNSRILFEFKSINDVVLKSDVVDVNQRNGVAICYVEVLPNSLRTRKEVEDGGGTLTMVGSLENKSTTTRRIPEKFKGAMNYRCTFPIEIRKNLLNASSPKVLQAKHKLTTTLGQFSFAKAGISTRRNTISGTSYSPNGGPRTVSSPGQESS